MDASSKQIGYIKGLIKNQGGEVDSEELSKLSYKEADRMIKALLGRKGPTKEENMKNKIISMAKTIGWLKKDLPTTDDKIDMSRLNGWCTTRGMYKKALDSHNYDELKHLVTQFQFGPFKHAMTKIK